MPMPPPQPAATATDAATAALRKSDTIVRVPDSFRFQKKSSAGQKTGGTTATRTSFVRRL
jgi:hypothetical protein